MECCSGGGGGGHAVLEAAADRGDILRIENHNIEQNFSLEKYG
jgi:hypothetical protein